MPNLVELIQPSRASVIIIDMQNDYVHRDGATLRYFRAKKDKRDMGSATGPSVAEQMAPKLIAFCAAVRRVGIPLIWVRTINDDNTVSPAAASQGKEFVWADDPWGTAFYEGLEPQPQEPIITKHRHSAFFGTDLDIILRRLDVRTVILTGVSTPYCVEGTARDAFARDYDVITVADCTASKVMTEHEEALARLGRVFGQVETSEQIMARWHEQ